MPLLFLTLLEISLVISPLIILVLIISPFLERRYSPKLQYALWLVLALRLLIIWNPLPEKKPLSIPMPQIAMIEELDNPNWLQLEPQDDFSKADEVSNKAESARKPVSFSFSPLQIIAFIWLVGASVFLLYHLLAYIYMCRKIQSRSNGVENRILLGQFQLIKNELGIYKDIRLSQCDSVNGPLLMGFIRPRIILTSSAIPSPRVGMVLRHELVHFKRYDLWAKLLLLLVRAVYWFNPFVHILAHRANRSIELCCDADALRLADGEQRKNYGLAILDSLEQKVMPAAVLHSGFSDGKRQMKKRFLAIINQSPKRIGWGIVCIILILSVLLSFVSCIPKGLVASAASPRSATYMLTDLSNNVLEKKALNPDTIGWLYVPDTSLNDPILFNSESNNYYTNRGFDGKYNETGSYFADRRSIFGTGGRDGFGRNTTIYGYSKSDDPDDPMFSQLKKYRDPEFARTHPYIFFSTEKEDIAWEVFAVFDAHVNLPYILSEPSDMSVEDLATVIRLSSIYNYDVDVKPEDRVLTLSTAVYSVDGHPDLSKTELRYDYRFAIAAKMVPPDEALKKEAQLDLNPAPVPPDTFKEI